MANSEWPAELKEIVLTANPLRAQQRLPDLRQCALHLSLRRLVLTSQESFLAWRGQALAIHLPVGCQRQLRQHYKRCRHHVRWNPLPQMSA